MPRMVKRRVQAGWLVVDNITGAKSAPFFSHEGACEYARKVYNPHTCRPFVVANYVDKMVPLGQDEYDVFR